jgi:hypothetical protein
LVAHLVLDVLVLVVVVPGLLILGNFDQLRQVFVNRLETSGHIFGRRDGMLVESTKFDGKTGIVAVVRKEGRTTNAGVLSIVV